MTRHDAVQDMSDLELAVGRVLRFGVLASSLCLAVGVVAALFEAGASLASPLLTTGLVLLLATPAARVVVSVVDYARERDLVFVTLTVIVLLELAGSVVAALYGGRG
jgi:uncharacterized membrane protein